MSNRYLLLARRFFPPAATSISSSKTIYILRVRSAQNKMDNPWIWAPRNMDTCTDMAATNSFLSSHSVQQTLIQAASKSTRKICASQFYIIGEGRDLARCLVTLLQCFIEIHIFLSVFLSTVSNLIQHTHERRTILLKYLKKEV